MNALTVVALIFAAGVIVAGWVFMDAMLNLRELCRTAEQYMQQAKAIRDKTLRDRLQGRCYSCECRARRNLKS